MTASQALSRLGGLQNLRLPNGLVPALLGLMLVLGFVALMPEDALLTQLESASLALENLKLDLVRFRSAGVSTALEDVTSATQEARAVSRDLGHLLDAHDEMKKL